MCQELGGRGWEVSVLRTHSPAARIEQVDGTGRLGVRTSATPVGGGFVPSASLSVEPCKTRRQAPRRMRDHRCPLC